MTPTELLKRLSEIFTGEKQRWINVCLFNAKNIDRIDTVLIKAIEDWETEYMLWLWAWLWILNLDKKSIDAATAVVNEFDKQK